MTDKIAQHSIRFVLQHRNIPAHAGVSLYQHPKTQWLFVKEGVLALVTLSGRHIVPAGHGILVPANIKHELIAKTNVDLIALYFSESNIEDWLCEPRVIKGSDFFNAMMQEALTLPKSEHMLPRHISLLALIESYLEHLPLLDTYLPYPQHEKLQVIVEKILKHPALKSDLVSWGKFVGLSARTITRRFKQETGLTYSQWRKRLNVQVAIKHLAQGDDIADIAKLLGYESSSAFIFMFRQQIGLSPKQFIKSLNF